ncbi:MAG: hypothetical protein ACK2UP_08980, partial [Candidatus Promineifilaceae bacterium]
MMTLSDGAFYNSSLQFLMYNLLPAHDYAKSVQNKLNQSTPNQLLNSQVQTIYDWVGENVTGYERPG